MAQRSIFDNPTIPSLRSIISELASGRIQIPRFQRDFEWGDERRLDLLDSIARGIPIGSLFVWQTSTHPLDCFEELGGFKLRKPPEVSPHRYLLDGHQRLNTLFGALNYEGERSDEDERRFAIYFDARATPSERAFKLHRRAGSPPDHWIKLSSVMHPRLRWGHTDRLRQTGDHDAADKILEIANVLSDYPIPLIPMLSEDLDLVTDSFVRINQSGKPMKEHNMLQALAFSTFRIQDRTAALREALAEHGWGELDEQDITNALKVSLGLDVYRAGPREIIRHYKPDGREQPDRALLERDFDALEAAFTAAVLLLNRCGIAGPRSLPYAYQLIAIAETYRRPHGIIDEVGVIKWLWITTYKDHFKGMTGNRIRDAIEHLCMVARGEAAPPPSNIQPATALDFDYSFQATRTKAFLLRLVAGDETLARAFGALGNEAVHRAHPALRKHKSPFVYVICPAHELAALHAAIESPETPDHQVILERHHIPVEAARALVRGEVEVFVTLRRAHLEARERAFIESLGLIPQDADTTV